MVITLLQMCRRFKIIVPYFLFLLLVQKMRIISYVHVVIIYQYICVMVYYIVSGLFLMFFWCPCMAINVNVQYNGGLLPDIILLTQCYLHRGTCLNAMKRFCLCSL